MCIINRIVIIGNGFDLAHNLKTRYEDFINWYWDEWFNKLRISDKSIESDKLCTFRLLVPGYNWFNYLLNSISPLNSFTGKDFINIKSDSYHIMQSDFLKRINTSIRDKNWVDIECEYYNSLNNEYFENPEKLNEEFQDLCNHLIKYLFSVKTKNINKNIIIDNIKSQILSPIKSIEVAITAQKAFTDFILSKCSTAAKKTPIFNFNDISSGIDNIDYHQVATFLAEYTLKLKNSNDINIIKEAIIKNSIPKEFLYPNRLMMLNFNYTNTADLYIPERNDNFIINHIHGDLNDYNSIILGYGDELDEKYEEIVKLNNNEHLRNIKSIKYLENANYRNMLSFIDSAPFQIYIMGHSCGNSDRTLLNTLFEHPNCISIKPFYHIREDGSDNYLEIIQNISRNFKDMKLMRDRVVNKTFCEPIFQFSSHIENKQ